jgi:hypothetical protein
MLLLLLASACRQTVAAADVVRTACASAGVAISHSDVTVTKLCNVSLHTCKEPVAADQANTPCLAPAVLQLVLGRLPVMIKASACVIWY